MGQSPYRDKAPAQRMGKGGDKKCLRFSRRVLLLNLLGFEGHSDDPWDFRLTSEGFLVRDIQLRDFQVRYIRLRDIYLRNICLRDIFA